MFARKGLGIGLTLWLSATCGFTHALQLEHVPETKKLELREEFAKAAAPNKKDPSWLKENWTCEMYGVRTSLQVERNLRLYRFASAQDKMNIFSNSGAQVVRNYHLDQNGLRGQNGSLQDIVRMTRDGRLVGELSIQSEPDRRVIAYSLCTKS